jgi:hypothetical protein
MPIITMTVPITTNKSFILCLLHNTSDQKQRDHRLDNTTHDFAQLVVFQSILFQNVVPLWRRLQQQEAPPPARQNIHLHSLCFLFLFKHHCIFSICPSLLGNADISLFRQKMTLLAEVGVCTRFDHAIIHWRLLSFCCF